MKTKKRAILLIPGANKRERFEARDLLVTAINHHAERFKTRIEDAGTDDKSENVVQLVVNFRSGKDDEIQISVFEAYWNDLVPAHNNETPWSRFMRATRLILYWAVGGLISASFGLPSRFRIVLVFAATILLLWYLSVLLVLFELLVSGSALTERQSSVPDWFDALLGDKLAEPIFSWLSNVASWSPIAFLLLLFGAGRMEVIANVADFAKSYLGDELVGENQIGLRTKMRKRVIDTLDHIFSREEFDDVVIVAHSFGGPIAIDALAEYGPDLAKTYLFTWGTPMSLLIHQEPRVAEEIRKLQSAPAPLAGWTDVVIKQDWIAGPMPVLTDRVPAAVMQLKSTMPKGRLFRSIQTHEDYYRCQEAIEPLVDVLEPRAPDKPEDRQAADFAKPEPSVN